MLAIRTEFSGSNILCLQYCHDLRIYPLNATDDVQQGIKGKDLDEDDDENKVERITRAVPSLAESPFGTT